MSKSTESKWDVYMSGALSDLTSEKFDWVTKEIYERVEKVCQSMGLTCYCPHKSPTTPTKGIPHSKVWKTDYERVVSSGAIVAYIGIPALGVGAEIEMARTANVPVILLCETSKQEKLSRLILGNPAIVDIVLFENPDEFEEPLKKPLFYVFSKRNLDSIAFEESWTVPKYRHLEQVLKDTVSGVAHRNLPRKPISKEEWKNMAKQKPDNQKTLF
ncbi:MAG: hypothetical protein DRP27_09975 [Thermotogae bacterium]|nr:MAG: hypothetical protein DRP27_09975 [Thermotogota bacterium]